MSIMLHAIEKIIASASSEQRHVLISVLDEKCGGPGSGVPGPCPAGGGSGSGSKEIPNEVASSIAKKILFVDTLEVRGRDSLDFHSVSVGGLNDAMHEAYKTGGGKSTQAKMEPKYLGIAQKHINSEMPTLRPRNMDSLDFYDAGVVGIKHALNDAYKLGAK